MGSISFSGRKSYSSSGWSGWGSVPATAIDLCYDGYASSQKQHVVYRASVSYGSGETLYSVSLTTNFVLQQYSAYDKDNHDTYISCYVYDFDPTSYSSRPSGEIGSAGTSESGLGYWGRAITFDMSVDTTSTTLWFWFEDEPSYVSTSGVVYKDAIYSYKTGNEYTVTPSISGDFSEYPPYRPAVRYYHLMDYDDYTVYALITVESGDTFTVPTRTAREAIDRTFTLTPDPNGGTLADPTKKGTAKQTGYIIHTALNWGELEPGKTYTYYFDEDEDYWLRGTYSSDASNVVFSVNVDNIPSPSRGIEQTVYSSFVCDPNYDNLPAETLYSYADASFSFAGWYTSPTGGVQVRTASGSGAVQYTHDSTIYAHWDVNEWKTIPSEVTLPTYTRERWFGTGFGTSRLAEQPVYRFGQTVVPEEPGTVYLYAIWVYAGFVYIYHDGEYHPYEVYIHHNGAYRKYMPYVYHNGEYVICV